MTDQHGESSARPAQGSGRYDLAAFFAGLDAIFTAHDATTRAEPFLREALAAAQDLGDDGARLSILNELIGFLRSQSRHDDATRTATQALELADRLEIAGTQAHTATLINAATAQRAAGHYAAALDLFHQALTAAEATLAPTDRRLAALHNNLSILFSEMQDQPRARAELVAALAILDASSAAPDGDLDIATTCTNLALVCFTLGQQVEAAGYVDRSLEIYRASGHEDDPHYASALAGQGEACFRMGRLADSVTMYRKALAIIAECYGTDNDYYLVTAENLAEAEAAAESAAARAPEQQAPDQEPTPAEPILNGLDAARQLWQTRGQPMLADKYPEYRGRIAAGLVGHGSECYGFDDEISRDHDFGPGFCLWLTQQDYDAIGTDLQADYDALVKDFAVGSRSAVTPRAQGDGRRTGVFVIGDFFEQLTGYREAPSADRAHEWLLLDEATLAAATNGAVFADPYGAFSAVRGGFTRMPRDVRLALISRRLGMISQAGQYNVPRMLDRGDGAAAWLAVAEFARAVASVVFLLNGPATAGYLPYYKWQFASLRRLSKRMGSRLPGVSDDLSQALRLAAACFGDADSDAEQQGPGPARSRLIETIEAICAQIVAELAARGLTRSPETFLEWQRPYVEEHITNNWLKSL